MRRALYRLTYSLPFWRVWVALDDWLLHRASRQTRYCLTGDNRSWCAHAFANRQHPFWRRWVECFGWYHCLRSYMHYHRD